MKKKKEKTIAIKIWFVTMIMLGFSAVGCRFNKTFVSSEKELDDVNLSENILFSINNGAEGYGTEWECTDATIMIYTDKTVHVFMDTDNNPEVCVLTLSDEDYEKLQKLTLPEAIMDIETEEELEATDGSSYFIKLYGEDDKEVFVVGGYMPEGKTFWKTYEDIKDILKPYGIEEEVNAYRNSMEEY